MFPKIFPHLKGILQFDASAKEVFPDNRPHGVVVHYTADRALEAGAAYLVSANLGYHLIVGRDGGIYQMTSLDRMAWHAGKAIWHGRSPNHHFLGVSLVSWGFLKQLPSGKFRSHTGADVDPDDVAQRPDNRHGIVQPWDAATPEQVTSLEEILQWCVTRGIDPDMVCGHDECALPPGRKADPGGVLPYAMSELRQRLKSAQPYV